MTSNTSNNDEHEGMMQCMECKQYFKECICFKSDGYIPKIWYCDRCYGRKESLKQGYAKALGDVTKIIKMYIEDCDSLSDYGECLIANFNSLKQEIAKLKEKT